MTRRRASLLASIAVLASLLVGESGRVICVGQGDHLAVEPVHTALACPTLDRERAASIDCADAASRDCVDLSLGVGGGSASLVSPSDSRDRSGVPDRVIVTVRAHLDLPRSPAFAPPRLRAALVQPDPLGQRTIVLLI